jgi:hypothetical protein
MHIATNSHGNVPDELRQSSSLDFKSHVAGNCGKIRARSSTVQLKKRTGSNARAACAMNVAAAIRKNQKRSFGN